MNNSICDNESCKSSRLLYVNGKTSDLCFMRMGEREHDGYVPRWSGVASDCGDYLEFDLCLDCGKVQGKFPKKPIPLEKKLKIKVQKDKIRITKS